MTISIDRNHQNYSYTIITFEKKNNRAHHNYKAVYKREISCYNMFGVPPLRVSYGESVLIHADSLCRVKRRHRFASSVAEESITSSVQSIKALEMLP